MSPAVLPLAMTLIEKVAGYFSTEDEKNKAKLALLEMEQQGQLEDAKVQLSAIITEAQSTDKWTSRARPSFMYVMYTLLLFGLPMGVVSVFYPESAKQIAMGYGDWLRAIPDELYALFGAGYLGYTGMKTWEKTSDNKVKVEQSKALRNPQV